jgi:adenylate kinase family enzyme
MKIMIFGDTASGKSSFAEILADTESVPVIHLDRIMDNIGREDRRSIGEYIKKEASKSNWIIEGNAFTKDSDYRIKQADIIYVFDFNRFVTLANHINRYIKIRSRKEIRKGGESSHLNLKYFVPYILVKFPPRKKEALRLARSYEKDVVILKSYSDIDRYLNKKTSL